MIPSAAIHDFLHRPRDDHRWVKDLSAAELDQLLNDLNPRPRLYPQLRLHQKACFLLGVLQPRFGFWVDMGGGKTLLSLLLMRYWSDCRLLKRGLVLLTSDKAYLTWQRQIERFQIELPTVFLAGPSQRKWDQLERFGPHGLVFVHYPGLVALLTNRASGRYEIDNDKVEDFAQGINALVADESTKIGHHASLTHKLVSKISRDCFARYALAGRPFGRDPQLAWAQYRMLDRGATLGATLGLFRAAFCKPKRNDYGSAFSADYVFQKKKMPQLTRMMQHRSITYATEEMPDLPPLERTAVLEEVALPGEAGEYYQRLIQQAVSGRGNVTLMKNIFVRMRQLSSGYIAVRDDMSGERLECEFEENPKLDRCLELVEALPLNRQAVIFYEFTHSGRLLYERLTEMGINAIWLWAGTKNPTRDLTRFYDDVRCSVAIVQNRVGAYSLDGLQVANYLMFFESPVSVIDREQAERRVLRDGQKRHVFQYDLVVEGTVDHKILKFHREGRDLYASLVRDPKKFFSLDA